MTWNGTNGTSSRLNSHHHIDPRTAKHQSTKSTAPPAARRNDASMTKEPTNYMIDKTTTFPPTRLPRKDNAKNESNLPALLKTGAIHKALDVLSPEEIFESSKSPAGSCRKLATNSTIPYRKQLLQGSKQGLEPCKSTTNSLSYRPTTKRTSKAPAVFVRSTKSSVGRVASAQPIKVPIDTPKFIVKSEFIDSNWSEMPRLKNESKTSVSCCKTKPKTKTLLPNDSVVRKVEASSPNNGTDSNVITTLAAETSACIAKMEMAKEQFCVRENKYLCRKTTSSRENIPSLMKNLSTLNMSGQKLDKRHSPKVSPPIKLVLNHPVELSSSQSEIYSNKSSPSVSLLTPKTEPEEKISPAFKREHKLEKRNFLKVSSSNKVASNHPVELSSSQSEIYSTKSSPSVSLITLKTESEEKISPAFKRECELEKRHFSKFSSSNNVVYDHSVALLSSSPIHNTKLRPSVVVTPKTELKKERSAVKPEQNYRFSSFETVGGDACLLRSSPCRSNSSSSSVKHEDTSDSKANILKNVIRSKKLNSHGGKDEVKSLIGMKIEKVDLTKNEFDVKFKTESVKPKLLSHASDFKGFPNIANKPLKTEKTDGGQFGDPVDSEGVDSGLMNNVNVSVKLKKENALCVEKDPYSVDYIDLEEEELLMSDEDFDLDLDDEPELNDKTTFEVERVKVEQNNTRVVEPGSKVSSILRLKAESNIQRKSNANQLIPAASTMKPAVAYNSSCLETLGSTSYPHSGDRKPENTVGIKRQIVQITNHLENSLIDSKRIKIGSSGATTSASKVSMKKPSVVASSSHLKNDVNRRTMLKSQAYRELHSENPQFVQVLETNKGNALNSLVHNSVSNMTPVEPSVAKPTEMEDSDCFIVSTTAARKCIRCERRLPRSGGSCTECSVVVKQEPKTTGYNDEPVEQVLGNKKEYRNYIYRSNVQYQATDIAFTTNTA